MGGAEKSQPTTSRRDLMKGIGSATIVAAIAGCSGNNDPSPTATTTTEPERVDGYLTSTPTDMQETSMSGTQQTPTRTATANRDSELPTEASTQFRGGLSRLGYYPDESVPETVEESWRINGINKGDHTAAKSSFVPLPSGNLVVPGDDGTVYCVTPGGDIVWTASTYPSAYGIHGTPAVAGGRVFVGAYDGAMYAFDTTTGEQYWRVELGDAIGSSPAYYDGHLYIAVEYTAPDGRIFAVDAVSGEIITRTERPQDHPHSTCAIDTEAGILVVGANDGNCYGFDWPGLEHRWTFSTGEPIKGPISIYNGWAFFGSWDTKIYAVRIDTGAEQWTTRTEGRIMCGPAIDPDNSRLFVGSFDNQCYALDLNTGAIQWSRDVGGRVVGSIITTGDRLLVGSRNDTLWALNASDGSVVWTHEVTGRVTSTPRVVDGNIYFTERATFNSSGSAYRLTSG